MLFNRLAKDSIVYGGADFITKLLSFFSFPLIASVLSPEIFGALELIYTITALLGLIVGCGINNAVQRFYWDSEDLMYKCSIVTNGLLTQMFFGVVIVFLGLVIIPFIVQIIQSKEWPMSWIALVSAALVMVLSKWNQYILDVIRLHFMPWKFLALALISRVLVVLSGLLAVVFFDLGVDGLLAFQVVVLLVVLPLGLWFIRKNLFIKSFDFKLCLELIKFGYPFIFVGLAYWLFSSMDRWMLASMSSVEDVGIYSVASRFASVVMFVSLAFAQAWSPIAMKIRKDHPDSYNDIYGKILYFLLFLMLVAGGGVAVFSGELITFLMPKEYLFSALPLSILCFGIVLQSTQQITAIGISIKKKTYYFARISWFVAAVNFVGNWFLIPLYGAAGAAIATTLSYFILTLSYMYFTQRLHPINVPWANVLILLVLGVGVLMFSVLNIETSINVQVIMLKISISFVCIYIGWLFLPVKDLKGI